MICRKKICFGLLCLALSLAFALLPSCGSTVYAYRITEAELTTLEQNLQTLAEHSKSKQKLLDEQSKQLQALNEQLRQSLIQNEETQNSLQTAEESLREYEAEAKRKAAIKDRQRNTWAAVAACALLWAAVK